MFSTRLIGPWMKAYAAQSLENMVHSYSLFLYFHRTHSTFTHLMSAKNSAFLQREAYQSQRGAWSYGRCKNSVVKWDGHTAGNSREARETDRIWHAGWTLCCAFLTHLVSWNRKSHTFFSWFDLFSTCMKLVGEGELMTCFVDHFATEFNLIYTWTFLEAGLSWICRGVSFS